MQLNCTRSVAFPLVLHKQRPESSKIDNFDPDREQDATLFNAPLRNNRYR
jgi:hypothetical protein